MDYNTQLPHGIDPSDLIARLVDPSLRIEDIASDLGVTVTQLLDAAEHPLVTSTLTRMDRLDRRRARRAAIAATPNAIQTLDALTYSATAAPPETRRKAASKVLSESRTTKRHPWTPSQSSTMSEAKARVSHPLPQSATMLERAGVRGLKQPVAQRRTHSAPLSPQIREVERAGERGEWNDAAQTRSPQVQRSAIQLPLSHAPPPHRPNHPPPHPPRDDPG